MTKSVGCDAIQPIVPLDKAVMAFSYSFGFYPPLFSLILLYITLYNPILIVAYIACLSKPAPSPV